MQTSLSSDPEVSRSGYPKNQTPARAGGRAEDNEDEPDESAFLLGHRTASSRPADVSQTRFVVPGHQRQQRQRRRPGPAEEAGSYGSDQITEAFCDDTESFRMTRAESSSIRRLVLALALYIGARDLVHYAAEGSIGGVLGTLGCALLFLYLAGTSGLASLFSSSAS